MFAFDGAVWARRAQALGLVCAGAALGAGLPALGYTGPGERPLLDWQLRLAGVEAAVVLAALAATAATPWALKALGARKVSRLASGCGWFLLACVLVQANRFGYGGGDALSAVLGTADRAHEMLLPAVAGGWWLWGRRAAAPPPEGEGMADAASAGGDGGLLEPYAEPASGPPLPPGLLEVLER